MSDRTTVRATQTSLPASTQKQPLKGETGEAELTWSCCTVSSAAFASVLH